MSPPLMNCTSRLSAVSLRAQGTEPGTPSARAEWTLADDPANDVPIITASTVDEPGASTTTNYMLSEHDRYDAEKCGSLCANFSGLNPAGNSTDSTTTQRTRAAADTSPVGSWVHAVKGLLAAKPLFYTYYSIDVPPGQDQGALHQYEIMHALNAVYANADTCRSVTKIMQFRRK
ncbi:hypothetical protein DOTSEDRAFT_35098 [Dothistroma septosporum NZE10]|uniref:Uncharacterized protein n=1 Tax=Dothistroma septosporum (strain NZE10 / CBS 128990) TaxID=675120 RepID=N1PP65_DOTSN|nr:hypothetical protein DOTSEDRAFT_35098 [Dothistroma septosporum NZE10]